MRSRTVRPRMPAVARAGRVLTLRAEEAAVQEDAGILVQHLRGRRRGHSCAAGKQCSGQEERAASGGPRARSTMLAPPRGTERTAERGPREALSRLERRASTPSRCCLLGCRPAGTGATEHAVAGTAVVSDDDAVPPASSQSGDGVSRGSDADMRCPPRCVATWQDRIRTARQ